MSATTAIAPVRPGVFTQDQIDLIKNTIAKGVTNDELALFVKVAERTGLDPFAKQVYAVKRKEKDRETGQYREVMSIQTGIDGYRLIAERTGKYTGQIGPYWAKSCDPCKSSGYSAKAGGGVEKCPVCGGDGVLWVSVWTGEGNPIAAKVGVLRSDFKEPLWGVARWKTYAQTYFNQRSGEQVLTSFWAKGGDLMIAKAAEALALRRAFPNETSGVRSDFEFGDDEPIVFDESSGPTESKTVTATVVKSEAKVVEEKKPEKPAEKAVDLATVVPSLQLILGSGPGTDMFLSLLPANMVESFEIPADAKKMITDSVLGRTGGDLAGAQELWSSAGVKTLRDPVTIVQLATFVSGAAKKIAAYEKAVEDRKKAEASTPPKEKATRKKKDDKPAETAPVEDKKPEEPAKPVEAPKAEAPKAEVKAEPPKAEEKKPEPEAPKAITLESATEGFLQGVPAKDATLVREILAKADDQKLDQTAKMNLTNVGFSRLGNIERTREAWAEAGVKTLKGYEVSAGEAKKFVLAVAKIVAK